MAAADVFLFPSISEGFPGVVQEAAAADLPVVASDIQPNREIAGLLSSVWTVPLQASDTDWAAAIARCLEGRAARQPRLRATELRQMDLDAESAASRLALIWSGHPK